MAEENKKRFPLWMYPETQKKVQELYEKDNCKMLLLQHNVQQ